VSVSWSWSLLEKHWVNSEVLEVADGLEFFVSLGGFRGLDVRYDEGALDEEDANEE